MSVWLAILGVSASTFLLRASFIVFADPHRFPKRFRRALAFVPPAVLAAIVVPGLLLTSTGFDLTGANPRWIAGVAAIVACARWRNVMSGIVTGMVTLWLLQWVMG
jgi:branched-subunit amino acid transport protein